MQLTELEPWVISGSPSIFTEMKDGYPWQVIDSDKAYKAGFSQVVYFDKLVKTVSLSVVASLYTNGGGLMLRLGVHPSGLTPLWSGWYGPDNGWSGEPAQILRFVARDLNTYSISVTLEGRALRSPRWPAKNICRWRDVQLEFEYADEPEPPEPDPEPPEPPPDLPDDDPRKWAIERMQQIQAQVVAMVETSVTLLEEVTQLALQLGLTPEEQARAQAWLDEYRDWEVRK